VQQQQQLVVELAMQSMQLQQQWQLQQRWQLQQQLAVELVVQLLRHIHAGSCGCWVSLLSQRSAHLSA
jgi:hypothetical protein